MAGMQVAEAAFGDRTRCIEPDHAQDGHADTGRDHGFSRREIRPDSSRDGLDVVENELLEPDRNLCAAWRGRSNPPEVPAAFCIRVWIAERPEK
jgi:hypothetical protein